MRVLARRMELEASVCAGGVECALLRATSLSLLKYGYEFHTRELSNKVS